jgi:hypothetical protein
MVQVARLIAGWLKTALVAGGSGGDSVDDDNNNNKLKKRQSQKVRLQTVVGNG